MSLDYFWDRDRGEYVVIDASGFEVIAFDQLSECEVYVLAGPLERDEAS